MGNTQTITEYQELRVPFDPADEEKLLKVSIRIPKRMYTELGWNSAMPSDVFVNTFQFLSLSDLARVASVNSSWKEVAYDESLWHTLNLTPLLFRANDTLLCQLLREPRFRALTVLSLRGCTALTDASLNIIAKRCPHLTTLFLNDCEQFSPDAILNCAKSLRLKFLELHGTTPNLRLAPVILQETARSVRLGSDKSPLDRTLFGDQEFASTLKLGLFWRQYCAAAGLNEVDGRPAVCSHASEANSGCWGRQHSFRAFLILYSLLL
jgi:hypothetical protein